MVETTEVGTRFEDAWFQESFYDIGEAASGMGGWVEEFSAEAC